MKKNIATHPLASFVTRAVIPTAVLILLPFKGLEAQQGTFDQWTIDHFQLARQAQLRNDLDVAAREYESVVAKNPSFAEAQVNLGVVYYQLKKYRAAVKTLRTAVALDPRSLGAQLFLGIGLYMVQDFQAALGPLQKSLELNKKDRQAGVYLALSYLALDQPEKAIRQLRRTARDFPEDVELFYHLAEAYTEAMRQSSLHLKQTAADSSLYYWAAAISAEQKNQGLMAIEWYLKALAIDPNIAELYLRLGLALEKAGLHNLASAAFDRYKLLNPNRTMSSLRVGEGVNVAAEKNATLAEHKKKFQDLWDELPHHRVEPSIANVADEPVNRELTMMLNTARCSNMRQGLLLYSKGNYQAAAELIKNCLKPTPQNWALAYILTRAYLLAFDYEAAEEILEERLLPYAQLPSIALLRIEISSQLALKYFGLVSSTQPDSFRARLLRAKYYAASNQTEEAIREYQDILRLAPGRLGVHLALGQLFSDKLDWPSAIEAYRSELALAPDNAMALAQLGHAYVEDRNPDRAIEVLEQLLEVHTTDAQAYADLGNAWRMKEEVAKAIDAYKRALFLDKSLNDLHYRLFQLYKKAGESQLAQMHLSKFKEGEAEKGKRAKRITLPRDS